MLGRDEVNIMDVANSLQFEKPFTEFFGSEIESVALVRDVLVARLAIERTQVEVGNVHDSDRTRSGDCTLRRIQTRCHGIPGYMALLRGAVLSRLLWQSPLR